MGGDYILRHLRVTRPAAQMTTANEKLVGSGQGMGTWKQKGSATLEAAEPDENLVKAAC